MLLTPIQKPDPTAVYRISWLRAKARRDRWEEECVLLRSEMEWTTNYYKNKSEEWSRLGTGSEGDKKHLAFAQSEMWIFLRDRAKGEFHVYLDPPS